MRIARRIADLRAGLEPLRPKGDVGFVPTMGALHAGHSALLETARSECAVVVASLFVNPAQFRAGEDFARYPRDEQADLRALERAGVDLAFLPASEEMYPRGFQTWVDVTEVSRGLEGDARPGHFRGVATVCLKLFNIVRPERAYFGRKDAQQLEVVGRMIRDLDLEVELRAVPTVRDVDGLALSSRNVYLSETEREAARALPRALAAAEAAFRRGVDPVASARAVLADEPGLATDYVELAEWNGSVVLAVAAWAGRTRLIDNVVLTGQKSG